MSTSAIVGQHAVITGASSGIGEETARELVRNGVRVTLAARRIERLEQLVTSLQENGGEALAVETDVTDRTQVEAMVAAARERFGAIDILVNNAGVMPLSFLKNLHVEEWDRMVDVNIKGVLHGIAAVLDEMRERKSGHIVNVSSVAGRRVFPTGAVYCATKFAITALSEGLRMELSPSDKIRITCIEPGGVDTELGQTITDPEVAPMSAHFAEMRVLDSIDIARAISYALNQPEHVNVAEMLVMPREQG